MYSTVKKLLWKEASYSGGTTEH